MKKTYSLEKIALLLLVIVGGIEVGGGLYEIRVIQPLIVHHLPESAWKFSELRTLYPEFAINPGFKFWKFTSPFILIAAISLLVLAFRKPNDKLNYFVISLLLIACFAVTALYFAPTTGKIMESQKMKLGAEETTQMVLLWVRLNWIRLGFYIVAWLLGLKSLINAYARKN